MRLLVLGGTRFIGPHIVEAALARGHEVALFNRGKTHPELFPECEKLRGDRDGDMSALHGREWDAVIDTWTDYPRHVRSAAELLREHVGQYLFVSSLNAVADLSVANLDESAAKTPLDPADENSQDNDHFGGRKARCEDLLAELCPEKHTVVRPGLIVDERFNSGGQIPDRFIGLLNRPALSYWAVRDAQPRPWPPVGHRGPSVMLINGWSGSGGDAFPFYFREAKLGPLIGTRTWGGLIGISGAPALVDGGGLTVPTFRMFDVRGSWFAEGHGVDPDIPVDEDPAQLAKGVDPQLERAIQEVQTRLQQAPAAPRQPAYEKR